MVKISRTRKFAEVIINRLQELKATAAAAETPLKGLAAIAFGTAAGTALIVYRDEVKETLTIPDDKQKVKILETSLLLKMAQAGTAACVGDLFTFPLDTAKVRLQVQGQTAKAAAQYTGVVNTIQTIAAKEGPKALYNGIVPGLQRQMAFSAIRIGMYEEVRKSYADKLGVDKDNLWAMNGVRVLAGITTGTLSILAAQPTDVVKVRMQAETKAANKGKSMYNGVFDAYKQIGKKEGMAGLWKGMAPNMARTSIINIGEVVVYDGMKNTIIALTGLPDEWKLQLFCASMAGFTSTVIASPVDVIKTRYMNSKKGEFRGAWDCAVRTAKNEGAMAFYKGFNASLCRLFSWNVVMWLTWEQMNKASKDYCKTTKERIAKEEAKQVI